MTIQLTFELGRLYSVPFADGITHGVLEEVRLEANELMFKIKPPAEPVAVWKSIPIPRKL